VLSDEWQLSDQLSSSTHYASRLGIPYFALTQDEWAAERAGSEAL